MWIPSKLFSSCSTLEAVKLIADELLLLTVNILGVEPDGVRISGCDPPE